MRVMLIAHMSTEVSNVAVRDGRIGELLQRTMGQLTPEAAYFGPHEGGRTAFIVFDLADVSQIPSVSEPFFQELGARVDIIPIMTAEDVARGLSAL
jgi:hypothetical protein